MTTYGVTDDGFVIKPLSVILEEIEDAQKAVWGDAIDVTATSVLGQLNGIQADQLSEVWELAQAVYSAMDPDAANTSSLENVAALCPGITRLAATKSTVNCNLDLDNGVYAAGALIAHVSGDTTARFVNLASVTQAAAPALVSTVAFEAETAGVVNAAIDTLNQIAEPVSGWNSVTNPAAATAGTAVETDAALRLRREEVIALSGASSVPGILADVLAVNGVASAIVNENVTDATDGDGLPPHSIHVVYKPTGASVDASVGSAIGASKPAGIATHGSLSTLYFGGGIQETIYFDQFSDVDVYFDLTIYTIGTPLTAGQQTEVENLVITLCTGSFIASLTFQTQVQTLLNTYSGSHTLTVFEMDTHDSPDENVSLIADYDESFVTDAGKIDISLSGP